MCKYLNVASSAIYSYRPKTKEIDQFEDEVIDVFYKSHSIYGSRKIRAELQRKGINTSRRSISRIMRKHELVSVYTKKKYRNHSSDVNESKIENLVNRDFNDRSKLQVVVNDLTYVRGGNNWNYICILLDLHAREIIGSSCGERKTPSLVLDAFTKVDGNLSNIKYFHTDRGSEFKNYSIDEMLGAFGITRSLSAKGIPYDNAVAEATFKIIKTEFVRRRSFESLDELKEELSTYIYWFNHKRIHSTLGYLSPVEYQQRLTSDFV